MNRFLLTAIVAGSIGVQGTKCADPGGRPPPPVFVVADGTPGWQRQQADRILDELNARLSSPHLLLVARFDAEPVPRNGFAVRKADRDLAMVSPRTPMRDTMEVGFALLRETPSPRTMIVIAQQQFYPTSVPTSFLLESARNSASRIYSIHLASEPIRRMEQAVLRVRSGTDSAVSSSEWSSGSGRTRRAIPPAC
jgi:hypothetical protein